MFHQIHSFLGQQTEFQRPSHPRGCLGNALGNIAFIWDKGQYFQCSGAAPVAKGRRNKELQREFDVFLMLVLWQRSGWNCPQLQMAASGRSWVLVLNPASPWKGRTKRLKSSGVAWDYQQRVKVGLFVRIPSQIPFIGAISPRWQCWENGTGAFRMH